jgi:hypothetical protein
MPTLGRNPEERSDEGSLVQRALKRRSARTARRAVSLLLLTMLVQREQNWVVAIDLRESRSRSRRVAESAGSRESTRRAETSSPRATFLYLVWKKPE